jgi:hypothetical protein
MAGTPQFCLAKTAFDSGPDAPVLLPVQTELRELLDRPLALSD